MKNFPVQFLSVLLLAILSSAFGDSYRDYNFPFFSGRQPSAKSEAMGKTLVASNDGAFTTFYNPAGIFLNKGMQTAGSYAQPFYLAYKAHFTFLGVTYNFKKLGTLGISWFQYSLGEELFISTVYNPLGTSRKYVPSTSFYTLSYAKEVFSGFAVGANLNLYSEVSSDKQSLKTYPIDLGFIKSFVLKKNNNNNQELSFGASVKNVFGSRLDNQISNAITQADIKLKEALPIVLRAGVAYQFKYLRQDYLPNLFLLGGSIQLEYEDILNYQYRTAFKFGAEFSLFQIFYSRIGHYSYSLDPSPDNGKQNLNDWTYGFGFFIPFDEFIENKIPLTISLDMTNLEQPSYVTDFHNWDSFSIYSLKIGWKF